MAKTPQPNSKGSSVTTNKDAGAANATDQAQGETATSPFRMGQLYEGHIVNGDNLSGVYTVRIGERLMEGCHWLANNVAGGLGMKEYCMPVRGSRCVVVYGNPSVIVRSVHGDPRDDKSGNLKQMTQTTDEVGRGNLDTPDHSDYAGANAHSTHAKDLFEGEYDLSNNLGVALQLLHSMAAIKGSERAKVEAFLINDMVRIISDCFKQFTAFGDMQVYNDGRLNMRSDGTSYEHEAWSLFKDDEEKATVSQFQVEAEEDLTKTGRWRFSQYIGFLGDFIHQFVTEPSATASSLAEGAFRPGKSRFQQMNDGSVLIQSVADISIERVCRVQVPVEKIRWDDPTGVNSDQFKELEAKYLKIWDYGGPDNKTIHHAAYQLREYARWLSCFHSYARFHQMADKGDEWEVPLETEVATKPDWKNQEKDVEAANNIEYVDAYACIRIMRGGDIVLWDGYGNGMVMGKSGIQLSAVDHIELDAGGEIRMTAGQDIILKARRNIEISAICGGLILKSCTWLKGLCERGVLWLKSDAKDPADPNTEPEDFENPRGDDGPDFPTPEVYDYAMLLETSQGRMGLRSERTMLLAVEGAPDENSDHEDVTGSIIIESLFQDVRVYSQRNALLKSQGLEDGVVGIESAQAVIIDTQKILCTSYLFDMRFDGDDTSEDSTQAITFKGGLLQANSIKANFMASKTYLAGPDLGKRGFVPHENHVLKSSDSDEPKFADADDLELRTLYEDNPSRNKLEYEEMFAGEGVSDPVWKFPLASDYKWPNEAAEEYPRQEPLAQQRTNFDSVLQARTEAWSFNTVDPNKTAPRTDVINLPYPGRSTQEMYHPDTAGDNLHEPLTGAYKDQDTQTALRQRQLRRRYRKRDTS